MAASPHASADVTDDLRGRQRYLRARHPAAASIALCAVPDDEIRALPCSQTATTAEAVGDEGGLDTCCKEPLVNGSLP